MSSFVVFIDLNKKYKSEFVLSIIIIYAFDFLLIIVINCSYEIDVTRKCCKRYKIRANYAMFLDDLHSEVFQSAQYNL